MSDQWRILVVEGEEERKLNVVGSLRKDGYIVLGVGSSAEAIRILWSEGYDLVVSELKASHIDGFELLQWMRSFRPQVKMVIVGPSKLKGQALEAGAVGYVSKPLNLSALKEELQRLLQQTGFTASLDSFDLLDVIQIINMSQKNILLLINTGLEERGTLGFQNGELIWAEYGVLRGEEAFFALAAHKNGTVTQQQWSEQIAPNVRQPLSRLIFQALQYRSKYAEGQDMSGEQSAFAAQVEDDDAPFMVLQEADGSGGDPFDSLIENIPTNKEYPIAQSIPNPLSPQPQSDIQQQYASASGFAQQSPSHPGMQDPFAQMQQSFQPQPYSSTPGFVQQSPSHPGMQDPFAHSQPGILPPLISPVFQESPLQTPQESFPEERPWWEGTGMMASVQPQAEGPEQNTLTPPDIYKTPTADLQPSQNLPSWVTDQPTHSDLPIIQMPAGASAHLSFEEPIAPVGERKPEPARGESFNVFSLEPSQDQRASAWGENSGISGQNHEAFSNFEGMATPPNTGNLGRQISYADEITSPQPGHGIYPTSGPSSQSGQHSNPRLPQFENDVLLAKRIAAGRTEPTNPPMGRQDSGILPIKRLESGKFSDVRFDSGSMSGFPNSSGAQSATTVQRAARRNYPAIIATLQSLGYSLPGFVATALATMDGQPIAQVTAEELDFGSMCRDFSTMLQVSFQVLEQGRWGIHEYMVVTSKERRIVIRLVGKDRKAFQVLVTTLEANLSENLDAMARAESAILLALMV